MIATGSLDEYFRETSYPRQDPEERRQIDAVLFSIWARGQKQRSGLNTIFLIFVSRLVSLLHFIVWLPRMVIRELPWLIISLAIGSALVFAFGISGNWQRAALLLSIYTIFRAKSLIDPIRNLLFDLGDILLLGGLTRVYIRSWESFGPLKELSDPEFALHLFVSRILTGGEAEKEIDAAQDFFSDPSNTTDERKDAIAHYWVGYPSNPEYWRSLKL